MIDEGPETFTLGLSNPQPVGRLRLAARKATGTIKALRRATGTDADVHGFRSSFRTWAAERSGATRDVAELALAHVVGGAVERSYARSDLFHQRRGLMDAWAAFVTGPVPTR